MTICFGIVMKYTQTKTIIEKLYGTKLLENEKTELLSSFYFFIILLYT